MFICIYFFDQVVDYSTSSSSPVSRKIAPLRLSSNGVSKP